MEKNVKENFMITSEMVKVLFDKSFELCELGQHVFFRLIPHINSIEIDIYKDKWEYKETSEERDDLRLYNTYICIGYDSKEEYDKYMKALNILETFIKIKK